jgi:serine protease Do
VDNTPVPDSNSFKLKVSRTPPGTPLHLKVLRDGSPREITVTPIKRPDTTAKDQGNDNTAPEGGTPTALRGLAVDNLTPDIALQLRLPANVTGVVVTDVEPGSPAADAGLRSGDVIQHVNRKPVTNVKEFNQALQQSGNDPVVLLVNRGGQTQFLAVEPSR